MHKSVLLHEVIELLAIKEGDTVVDGTLGAGGHSEKILEIIGSRGVLIGIDQDETALKIAGTKLKGKNVRLCRGNFSEIKKIVNKEGFDRVNAILLDIGVSSMQLDESERGFSFSKAAPLDMRMDQSIGMTAAEIISSYSEEDLTRIFREYGEEPMAKRIAKRIVEVREIEPINTTDQLAEVVRGVKRTTVRSKEKIDPATKVFQALRIEVNSELSVLESALPQLVKLLEKGGRFGVISFHSLEDRIVKRFIEKNSIECTCGPESPICTCNTRPSLKRITKKPVVASEEETKENPRSRSAKLRVAEKI